MRLVSYIFILCLFFVNVLLGQKEIKQKDKVQTLYDHQSYSAALEKFGDLEREDNVEESNMKVLADSYRLIGNMEQAAYWYGEMVENNVAQSEDVLYYAQALLANGKYEEAKRWFLKYNETMGGHSNIGKDLAQACDLAKDFPKDKNITVKNMAHLNSDKLDFSPIFYKDGLVFTSTRGNKQAVSKHKDLWSNDNFMDLYFSNEKLEDRAHKSEKSELNFLFQYLNFKYHDGTATFSRNEQTMYFARSNQKNGRRKKDDEGITRLKIYEAKYKNENWESIVELDFNSDDFNTCHPSLSADGQVLYFASDRPEGFGGMDIYKVKKEKGGWSAPENLGAKINTEGNEVFPYVHADGSLFFASNGLAGLGGLDIFQVMEVGEKPLNPLKGKLPSNFEEHSFEKSENKNLWTTPRNLGAPINSNKDDLSLIVDISGTKGYFASNRAGGKGMDDIYSFSSKKGIQNIGRSFVESMLITANICVEEVGTAQRISNATISINEVEGSELPFTELSADAFLVELKPVDENRERYEMNLIRKKEENRQDVVNQLVTNENGLTSYAFYTQKEYRVLVEKVGYESEEFIFSYHDYLKNKEFCVSLKKKVCDNFTGTVLNKKNNKALAFSKIMVVNKCTREKRKLESDEYGKFSFCMDCNCNYDVMVTRPYFSADLKIVKNEECGQPKELSFYLTNDRNGLVTSTSSHGISNGTSSGYAGNVTNHININIPENLNVTNNKYKVGQVIELKNIFYDFDGDEIRTDAEYELDKVVFLLQKYPTMKLELGAHTDARGTQSYNRDLSFRRARSAVNYITSQGISKNRILTMGYGEQVLKNYCSDGIDCPEEAHQRNRRTEIKVLEFDASQIDVRYIDNLPEVIDRK